MLSREGPFHALSYPVKANECSEIKQQIKGFEGKIV